MFPESDIFSVNLPIGLRLFDTVLPIVGLSEIDDAKCLLDLEEDEEIEGDDVSSIVSSCDVIMKNTSLDCLKILFSRTSYIKKIFCLHFVSLFI